ncbi:uncharacterized protein LOC135118785 [Helicoverpa armigera]|uniref:uncharacterized protein LOC135118785 n=1 Tax=Helicoverpa armigera TaxID=29058 RepID=UPI003083C181
MAFLAFDLDLVYAIRVIVLLRKYLKEWVQMVSRLNYDQDDGYDCVKLFKIYQNILQAFELYKAVSQFLVMLMNVFGIVWLFKDLSLVILQSMECEKFYIAVEEAKMVCIQLIMKNSSESQKRLYKQVLHMNRMFSKMSACGLFYIDATLPTRLMGLIASYYVLLLQFALL